MSYELIELELIEKTEKYYFFKLKIEKTILTWRGFGGEIVEIDAAREIRFSQSFMISNGKKLWLTFSGIDDSINMILDREHKAYKKGIY